MGRAHVVTAAQPAGLRRIEILPRLTQAHVFRLAIDAVHLSAKLVGDLLGRDVRIERLHQAQLFRHPWAARLCMHAALRHAFSRSHTYKSVPTSRDDIISPARCARFAIPSRYVSASASVA